MSIFDVDTGPKKRRPAQRAAYRAVDEVSYLAALSSVASAENLGVVTSYEKISRPERKRPTYTAKDGAVFHSHQEYYLHEKSLSSTIIVANRLLIVSMSMDGVSIKNFGEAKEALGMKQCVRGLIAKAVREGRETLKRNGKVLEWTLAKGE